MAEVVHRSCQFYLVRKKRYCKFAAQRDTPYCAEHSHVLNDASARKRIVCPRDGKHTCYEDELSDHLKHCNVTKRSQRLANLDYYAVDYNIPNDLRRSTAETDHSPATGSFNNKCLQQWRELQAQRLVDFSGEDLLCVIKELEAIYNDEQYAKYFRIDQVRTKSSTDCGAATNAKSRFMKEQTQLKCIFDALKARDIFETETCETVFVELGAGRGGLTEHFCKQLCEERSKVDRVWPKAHFVLVERSPARNKLENKLKRRQKEQDNASSSSTAVKNSNADSDVNSTQFSSDCDLLSDAESKYNVIASRIRLDIKDLKLSRLPPLVDNADPQVHFLAKHLCGSATDLIINCIVNYVTSGAKRPYSLCLALCCHHRCDYAMLSLPARAAWHKLGLTVRHFRIATLISAWATCGFQKSEAEPDADVNEPEANASGDVSTQADNAVVQLSSKEKERVGFVAKRVIDLACRLLPLSSALDRASDIGSSIDCTDELNRNDDANASSSTNNAKLFDDVYLCEYIDHETTPENVLLIATNRQRN